MATPEWRIISGDESEMHTEPHIGRSRITVRDVNFRVENRGIRPEHIADRYNLDIADVYEALAYYHNNPEEMQPVEERHERAGAEARQRSSLTPSDR